MTELAVCVDNLRTILLAEEELYLRMRTVLSRDEEVLIALDPRVLAETVEEKRMLAEEGRLLEESRTELIRELAASLGLDATSLKLSELIAAFGDEAGDLPEVHARLAALVASTRTLVDANQGFANRSLGRVQETLRLLGRSLPDESGYGPARRSGSSTGRGRLVRQAI